MARVTRNVLLEGVSGKIGNVIVRQVGGQTIVSAAEPKGPRAPRSPKQQAQLERMYRAQLYAKAQMQDPDAKALYATGIDTRRTSAYTVAIADYLHAPVLLPPDLDAPHGGAGRAFRLQATDDFGVTAVQVRLLAPDGTVVEEGAATPQPDASWLYVLQQPEPLPAGTQLHLAAHDRPGNVTRHTHPL